MIKKNDILDLEIIDNGSAFEGIAKHDGMVIFVPGAVITEKVRAKIIKVTSSYAIARVEEILVKSEYREEPFCEVFKYCGGCMAQNVNYDMQLLIKKNMVKTLLDKQKLEYDKLNNTVGQGMPYYYRNKVQYPVRLKDSKTIIGFYRKNSHDIVENKCCYIQNRVIDILAKNVVDELTKEGFKGYSDDTKSGDIRHILIRRGYHTSEVMIVIVVNNEKILSDYRIRNVVHRLVEKNDNIKNIFLNLNTSNTNEILGEKLKQVYGMEKYISDYIGDYKFFISPKSFFQVNTIQAEVLYNTLKKGLNLKKEEILFDLYSGVGSIGIFLSQYVKKVYGIEIEKTAVEMANLNLKENNVINAEYIAGSVEDKIVEFKNKNIKPDVIVVDPPRKGLDEKSIEYILEFNPTKIGYVSCNPATMARDLKMLSYKYDILSITPVDMFPHTSSVECVAILYLK
ncbi:MAG: 23S rRNA (uracil(1939)-C(5))-methyltransferase RlmD [Bacilli bacterium]|nr:23S rRNA (uracil(1939)-C(5))-methyltransferase RlmD [Bacilli bacterium]